MNLRDSLIELLNAAGMKIPVPNFTAVMHKALKARLALAQWDDMKAAAETIVAAHESSGKAYRWACKVLETYDAEHQA